MSGVGVLVAMPSEARAFLGHHTAEAVTPLSSDGWLCVGGIGPERARAGARELLERGARGLVSFGVCGGLARDLRAGALVLADSVLDETGASFATDRPWRTALADRLGNADRSLAVLSTAASLLTVYEPIADRTEKREANERTGAVAVDMESAAIGEVAHAAGVPFLVVRAVSDDARANLPLAALSAVDSKGRPVVRKFLRILARRPHEILDLWRLRGSFRTACRTLRGVVRVAGTDLMGPAP